MTKPLQLHRFTFAAMGSPCELQLYAADAAAAQALAQRLRAEVQRLELRYSRYRDDSLLSEINRVAAAGGSIDVDAETGGLLDYADTCYRQSDGLFDITSGLLRAVWRFKGQAALPAAADVEALLARVGWQRVRWQAPTLTLPAGMELDFGGIVKEYAADRLAALCGQAHCHHAVVNLGGDIRVAGPHPDGQPWRIGIQDPHGGRRGAMSAALRLGVGGVATSGDYERCMVVDGVRYGHVLNPRTGWPVRHLASVTVIADYCVVAGSAATIALLKERDGPAWLASIGVPHSWVDSAGNRGGTLAGAE